MCARDEGTAGENVRTDVLSSRKFKKLRNTLWGWGGGLASKLHNPSLLLPLKIKWSVPKWTSQIKRILTTTHVFHTHTVISLKCNGLLVK